MKKKDLILIGTLPIDTEDFTYTDGQAEAFLGLTKIIRNNFKKDSITIINILRRSKIQKLSFFIGMVETIKLITKVTIILLSKSKSIVYITTAQSQKGLLRDLYLLVLAKMRANSVFLHIHGGGIGEEFKRSIISRFFGKWVYNSADKVIILDQYYRDMFLGILKNSEKIFILENFSHAPSKIREIKNNKLKVLYLSNLIKSKGYLIALDTAYELKKLCDFDFEFNFYGNFVPSKNETHETCKDFFNKSIQDMGLSENAKYGGNIYGSKKHDAFFDADFFILPSSYENEGIPISIIEALSYGCVVLTSKHRALPFMIDNNVSGFSMSPDPEKYAKKIIEIVNDGRLENLRQKSRKHYQGNYSKEIVEQKIISLFSQC